MIAEDSLLFAVGLLLVGFAVTVLRALARRLGERVAVWCLPDGQPSSFRLAWILLRLAEAIVPERRTVGGWEDAGLGTLPVDWPGAREARADLESSLNDEQPVPRPIRLVMPLLFEALRLRITIAKGNARASASLNALYVFLIIIGLCRIVYAHLRLVRGLARRLAGRDDAADKASRSGG